MCFYPSAPASFSVGAVTAGNAYFQNHDQETLGNVLEKYMVYTQGRDPRVPLCFGVTCEDTVGDWPGEGDALETLEP